MRLAEIHSKTALIFWKNIDDHSVQSTILQGCRPCQMEHVCCKMVLSMGDLVRLRACGNSGIKPREGRLNRRPDRPPQAPVSCQDTLYRVYTASFTDCAQRRANIEKFFPSTDSVANPSRTFATNALKEIPPLFPNKQLKRHYFTERAFSSSSQSRPAVGGTRTSTLRPRQAQRCANA